MSILERIRNVLVNTLGEDRLTANGVKIDEITEKTKFIDDLGLDSIDIMQLIMGMEEEFDLEVGEEEAEKLQTVAAVIDYIQAQRDLA